jgi:hypothetical protein
MNKQTLQLALLCLLAASAVTHAHAQSMIAVKVPFDFSISEKTFPAGQYLVSSSRDHFTVQDSAGKPVFIGIANQIDGRRAGSTGMVVFHCYDGHCFLSEFWTPGRENGSQLQPSRSESALAKHKRGTEFALLDQTQQH